MKTTVLSSVKPCPPKHGHLSQFDQRYTERFWGEGDLAPVISGWSGPSHPTAESQGGPAWGSLRSQLLGSFSRKPSVFRVRSARPHGSFWLAAFVPQSVCRVTSHGAQLLPKPLPGPTWELTTFSPALTEGTCWISHCAGTVFPPRALINLWHDWPLPLRPLQSSMCAL